MFRFVLRRIGMVIPTFIGITILAFALIHLIPGDPIEVVIGERGVDPAMHAEAMKRLGLDLPLPVQYFHYVGHTLKGDLGMSIITNTSVMGEFMARFPATLELTICAMNAVVPETFAKDTLLVADKLARHYSVKHSMFQQGTVKALNGVSFSLERGKTLAVVGESGCGKSTLARQLTMIEAPTSGRLLIDGEDVANVSRAKVADLRQRVQMVFQNPFASLNPRKTVEQTLGEPLAINTKLSSTERAERIAHMIRTVGLRPEHAARYPHMFSGGQRQRVAIARAMILDPQILVADEPLSAMDVSIQAQILNLFMDLQQQFGTSYVFISHNLSVVEHIADDVMVMYFGGVAELGDKATIYARPRHPYTRALMSATPALFEEDQRIKIRLQGEMPSPLNSPSGCTFHQRCPYAIDKCRVEEPALRFVDGWHVSCHRAEEGGEIDA